MKPVLASAFPLLVAITPPLQNEDSTVASRHSPPISTQQQIAHQLKGTKPVIMARNFYLEDVDDEWQLVRCGDGNTIPATSEDDEYTLRAESEVGESILTRNYELPLCLNASDVIEVIYNGNDEVGTGDTDHRLYSKAVTVIDEVGLPINGSKRDAIPLVESNEATTGNHSDGQPTRRLYYENMTVASGHIGIDIETETGRIKWTGPMSEFPASMEQRQAAKNGISEPFDNRTVMAQGEAKTTGLDIEIGLGKIQISHLQALKDKDEAQVIKSPQNGADANSEDSWGPALTQAIRWENETVVMEVIGRGADANATDDWEPAITHAQSRGLTKTVKELLKQGTLAPPKIQNSSPFGQTTIKGVFPTGTKLDISTPDGTRQIIASGQPIIARNVSASHRSFQFVGDVANLDAILRERSNIGC